MNKKVIALIFTALVLILSGFGTYYYFTTEDAQTSFTKMEREWIENNKLKLIDIAVENDIPVFNYVGEGLVFDCFKDFESNTGLEFNRISYSYSDSIETEYSFKVAKEVKDNQINIYEDSYVLLTIENNKYSDLSEITKLKIGVLKEDVESIRSYLKNSNNEIKGFSTLKELETALGIDDSEATIDGVMLPKMFALKYALNSKNHIAYLANDLTTNYVIELGKNDKLNTIIKKYYKKWKSENYEEAFNKYFTDSYFEFSGINQNSLASFKGKRYIYGYTENAPYDLTIGDDLYGSNKAILESFSKVADIEINYKKYANLSALMKAFEKDEIDLFFNNTKKSSYDLNGFVATEVYTKEIVIISSNKVSSNITSLRSLKDKQVAVLENSYVASKLTAASAWKVEYKTMDELINSKEKIIALDLRTYDYYKETNFANYKIEYTEKETEGYGYTMNFVKPQYISSTTLILVSQPKENGKEEKDTETITSSDISLNSQLVSTYGEIIKSKSVLKKVIRNLDLEISEESLKKKIDVKAISNSGILKVSVVFSDPQVAETIANEIAQAFIEKSEELYKIDNVKVLDEAEINTTPTNINHKKDIILFVGIGACVSALYIWIIYAVDTTVKATDDLEKKYHVTVLASIPNCTFEPSKKKGDR